MYWWISRKPELYSASDLRKLKSRIHEGGSVLRWFRYAPARALRHHPKALVNIGYRPILWHLMRYYAHFGHNDFILCLGYRGDLIRDYFINYNECMSNDFILSGGGKKIELLSRDLDDWRITFVDTGFSRTSVSACFECVSILEMRNSFLANYADGLSDLPLDPPHSRLLARDVTASFLAVQAAQSFHGVQSDDNGIVTGLGRCVIRTS